MLCVVCRSIYFIRIIVSLGEASTSQESPERTRGGEEASADWQNRMIDELHATVETLLKRSNKIINKPKLKVETTECKKLKKGCLDSELERIQMLNKVKNGLDMLRSTDKAHSLPMTNGDAEKFPSLASSGSSGEDNAYVTDRPDNTYVNDSIINK